MTLEDLARQVQILSDRQAIRDVINRYCRGMDRMDVELVLSCYHADAIDDHCMFVGHREEFEAWARGAHQAAHSTQHIVTTHNCELDGDVAHAETYWMSAQTPKVGDPLVLGGGRYVDRLEKRNGEWRIAARKCLFDWRGKPGERKMTQAVMEAINSCGEPARDRTDPSYERPLTIARERLGFSVNP